MKQGEVEGLAREREENGSALVTAAMIMAVRLDAFEELKRYAVDELGARIYYQTTAPASAKLWVLRGAERPDALRR